MIDQIIASIDPRGRDRGRALRHAVRAAPAKVSGVGTGDQEILGGLTAELAQGLFATPRTPAVVVRFAQGPGEILKDSGSTTEGWRSRCSTWPARRWRATTPPRRILSSPPARFSEPSRRPASSAA